METLQKIALIFTIIGALNWGLVALFDINLVTLVFDTGAATNIIYMIIGLSGLINIGIFFKRLEY